MSDKAARRVKFEEVWSTIHTELVAHIKGQGMPDDAVEWFSKVRVCRLSFDFIKIDECIEPVLQHTGRQA